MFLHRVCFSFFGVLWFALLTDQVWGAENIVTESSTRETATERERSALAEVLSTIGAFVREYARQHQVSDVVCKLDETIQVFEGAYFTSEIVKLVFSYKTKEGETLSSSVLVKVPEMGELYDHGKSMLHYDKEKFMYEVAFPLMYKNLTLEKLVPNFYVSTDSGILILENLRESGYRGWPKGTLLDFDECDAVWKALAQFHAISIIHLDEIADQLDSFVPTDYSKNDWFNRIMPAAIEAVRKHVLPKVSESIQAKFEEALNVQIVLNLAGPNKDGRNVLLHGDAHASNILFRKDEENDELKIRFIDFQQSRRGSPIRDLLRFTVLSVKSEVFDEHRDTLFSHYVLEFNRTLRQLKAPNKKYSFEELEADFQKFKLIYFRVLCGDIPPIWAGDISTNKSPGEENAIVAVAKSDIYVSTFKTWAKHLLF